MEQKFENFLIDYIQALKDKYNDTLTGNEMELEQDKNFRLGANLAYYDCLDVLEQQLKSFGYGLTEFGKVSPDIGRPAD